MKVLREHGLSVAVAALYAAFKVGAVFTTPEDAFWYATLHGHSDDAFGALLIIVATKWFRERGSAASK